MCIRDRHKLKETDEIVQTMESTNKSELIFFSNKCVAYKMKTYDLADAKVSTMGEYLPGILGLEEDEKIVYTVVTTDYKGEMLFTFENGKMAKVALSNYETKTNRKKLIGAYGNKSPICDIRLLDEDKDVVLMSDNNRVLLVNTEKIQERIYSSEWIMEELKRVGFSDVTCTDQLLEGHEEHAATWFVIAKK